MIDFTKLDITVTELISLVRKSVTLRPVVVYECYLRDDEQWDTRKLGEGLFHAFGIDYNDEGQFSVAIVEMPDGKVINPAVELIKFIY